MDPPLDLFGSVHGFDQGLGEECLQFFLIIVFRVALFPLVVALRLLWLLRLLMASFRSFVLVFPDVSIVRSEFMLQDQPFGRSEGALFAGDVLQAMGFVHFRVWKCLLTWLACHRDDGRGGNDAALLRVQLPYLGLRV